jgi:hypothetical protein
MKGRAVTAAVVASGVIAAVAGAVALPPGAQGPVRIAYVTGSSSVSVWVANADGSGRHKLGPGGTPMISPSGELVAASVQVGGASTSLAIYPVAGGSRKTYLRSASVGYSAVGWSPDSRYLAVQLFGDRTSSSGLSVIDTTTGSVRTIVRGNLDGAGFAPALPYRIAYALSEPGGSGLAADIYTVAPDGTGRVRLTRDHRSLLPVWGPTKIAYDHERLRGRDAAPEYQIWLMDPDGSHRSQLTRVRQDKLVAGLVPAFWSADGERLAARLEGQDVTGTWAITIQTRRAREIKVAGGYDDLGGLSLDGSTLLIGYGGFEGPPSQGTIASVPFGGGHAKVLVRHAGQPTWNR